MKEDTLLAGRYLLGAELGSGGMGSVFRATDLRTGGPVAVKVLHPALARNAMYRERLRREAQIVASLTSPRVVRVIDLDEHEGVLFLVLEFVAGETLDRRLRREGRLPLAEALEVTREVARALEAAHAAGIVHRDLKPENITVVDGQVKVLDFGIARADGIGGLTATNTWVGTVEYCAPERAAGLGDIRADVYSLGVILFALVTGRLPFEGPTPLAVLRQHESAPPPIPPDLPPAVQAILARCLAKQPEARYQTPGALVADLSDALEEAARHGASAGGAWQAWVRAGGPAEGSAPAASGDRGETAEFPGAVNTRGPADRSGAPGDTPGYLNSAMNSVARATPAWAAPTPKAVPPGNLPAQMTSFVGREQERRDVRHLLEEARVLTLTGTGGIGKTRLALRAAADVMEEFHDGAWVVELAPLRDPEMVPRAVAAALGVREAQEQDLVYTLADSLRERRLLLVLDNCEHVVEACAALVQTLAQACPHLHVLATSREPLGVAGERLWRVPPLDVQSEAVQLFMERASAARPGFQAAGDAEHLVAEICWRLDGLPLAIELAAARVKVLSLEEIAARLVDRFRLLTGGSRTGMRHQQTLRAAIDWSYALLSAGEQRLFRRLGVFARGCTLEAAEAVAKVEAADEEEVDVLDGLAALLDKSLLTHEAGAGGRSRYVMLQTIREYALERLRERGEELEIARRHLAYCAQVVEKAALALRGADQLQWLEQLDQMHDNLRAVLDWCADHVSPPDAAYLGLQIATELSWYWYLRGLRNEGRARIEVLLRRARAVATAGGPALPAAVEALALATEAHLAMWGNAPELAVPLAEQACRLARATGDATVLAWALLYRAVVDPRGGEERQEGVEQLWHECLTLFRQVGDNWGVALALSWLGHLAYRRADLAQALQALEECQSLFRLLGDRWGIALALARLASVAELRGDDAAAEAYLQEQQTLARALGHRGAMAGGLNRLAAISLRRNDAAQAQARFEQSLATFRAIGERRSTGAPLRQLARLVARYYGDYVRAQALLEESLRTWQEQDGPEGALRSLLGYVEVALLQGQAARAGTLLDTVEAELRCCAGVPTVLLEQLGREAAGFRQELGQRGVAARGDTPPSLQAAIQYALGSG